MKSYVPSSDMRTNPLSKNPGGSRVTLIYENHKVIYENIKNPRAYIDKFVRKTADVVEILVDNCSVWKRKEFNQKFKK